MASPQHPIGSGFGPRTTGRGVVGGQRLTGRHVVITGGASGIGLETTRALAEAGARVIVGARSVERARQVLGGLPGVDIGEVDLLDPLSVDRFARNVLERWPSLDVLINNAGVMACPLARDARGHESQFAANHLGHFQLTLRLWPGLQRASAGARVVCVSSRGHRITGVHFDDVGFHHHPYDKWQAYGQSKTANVLCAVALDARGERHGIRAFSLHPGAIATPLLRHLDNDEQRRLGVRDEHGLLPPERAPWLKSAEQGAATSVWCAVSPKLSGHGGVYCEDADVARVTHPDQPDEDGVRPWAVDRALAERLWSLSAQVVGMGEPT